MLNLSLWALCLLILRLGCGSHGSPVAHTASRLGDVSIIKRGDPEIVGCTDDEVKQIKGALEDLSGLAQHAIVWLDGDYDWKKNKGYTHYFKEEDHDKVSTAFKAILSGTVTPGAEGGMNYKIRCGKNAPKDCKPTDFAHTDPTPEDFDGGPHETGVRFITICPLFFNSDSSKRKLPGEDEDKKKEYCKFKESKRITDFETGASVLLHEMSHLDSFGRLAGYPEETAPAEDDVPEYKYHGTIDWNKKYTAENARILRNSKAKNKPQRWQNAESLAASAMEMYAMDACELKDIPT